MNKERYWKKQYSWVVLIYCLTTGDIRQKAFTLGLAIAMHSIKIDKKYRRKQK